MVAHLCESTGSYCCHLDVHVGISMGVGWSMAGRHTLKFCDKVFLCDVQGAVR